MKPDKDTLLLVDDDAESLTSLRFAFSRSDYRVLAAGGGAKAVELLGAEPIDVVVTDLRMPEVDGIEVLRRALALERPPTVILLTAFGSIESAVEALRIGAFHYLTKPVSLEDLRQQVEKAMERQRRRRVWRQRPTPGAAPERDAFAFEGVVGETPQMLELMSKVKRIAKSKSTVLIEGESGTGKELVARAVHFGSPRRDGPFVPVHCAAISETLLESELFGHEKGSFTGAIARKRGQIESAAGGTLFLDEISEIPLAMQVKLLRVLETYEFCRVGGIEPLRVDVRTVAATNRDLPQEVKKGSFREDLFYRLNVVRLRLPPLRERLADIPPLTGRFVEEFARENGRPTPEIDPSVFQSMAAYDWPGNIRELRNVVENLMIFHEGERIETKDLPVHLAHPLARTAPVSGAGVGQTLEDVEAYLIRQTLEANRGNRTRAAEILGISRRTLQRKIKELNL